MNHDARQVANELQQQLSEVTFPLTTSAANALRSHVCKFAAALKADGIAPEKAINAVKDVLRSAGLELSTHTKSTEAVLTPRDHLLSHVVSWCIEGYYRDGGEK